MRKGYVQLVGLADGSPHEIDGQYLVSYDPEYHSPEGYDGGALVTTSDRAQAPVFDVAEALLIWKSGPTCKCHRLRPDGKPNRPLSAFSFEWIGQQDQEEPENEPQTKLG